ncbi:MAG: glucose-1-phosphate cytidylyltransferase [Planctomycetota bacterium]
MNTVILAGGLGTRLSEETDVRPKPMVEVGGKPLLWHIMRSYSHYGNNDFVVALGYLGEVIKRFFLEYHNLSGSMAVNLSTGDVDTFDAPGQDWFIRLIETGMHTDTGGRLRRLQPHLKNETFMLTYGDGLASVDVEALVDHHRRLGRIATITAVRPPARFGGIVFEDGLVREFTEKPQVGEGWINGGFMVFEPEIFRYLEDDSTSLERHALERLASEGELAAYCHEGFWQCADTLRDVRLLRRYWKSGEAPWKVWDTDRTAPVVA